MPHMPDRPRSDFGRVGSGDWLGVLILFLDSEILACESRPNQETPNHQMYELRREALPRIAASRDGDKLSGLDSPAAQIGTTPQTCDLRLRQNAPPSQPLHSEPRRDTISRHL